MTDAVPPKRPSLPKQLQLFGEYVVDALVEEGPTWALYRALHIANENQRYRVRVLQGVDATRRQVIEAFARMAILLDSLKHEGIIPVSAAGVDQGLVFVINAEVPGITLEQRVEKGPTALEPNEIVRIVRETAAVLDYLHQHDPPIIHHTLEPSKILLSQPTGSVKVLEVGYAHAVDEVARVEAVPHAPTASEKYRAPEDVAGAAPRAAIDQFALARIAKVCLESRKSPVLEAALRATEAVIARATETDPAARFPSAGAFAKAFADALDQASARANAPTDQHPAAAGMVPSSVGAPRTRKPTPPAIFGTKPAAPPPAANRKATIIGTPGPMMPPPKAAPPPPQADASASGPPKKISGSLPIPRPAASATSSPSAKALADATATSTQKGLGSPPAPSGLSPVITGASAPLAPPPPSASAPVASAAAPAVTPPTEAPSASPATASSDAAKPSGWDAPMVKPGGPPPLPPMGASHAASPPPMPSASGASGTASDPFSDVPVETISMVPLDEFDKSQVTSVSTPDEKLLAQAFPSDPPPSEGAITKDMATADGAVTKEMPSAVSTAPLYGGPPAPSALPSTESSPKRSEPALPSAFAAPSAAPDRTEIPRPAAVPSASSTSITTPPPAKSSRSSAVRIATILGVSIVLASVVYTAGFMLREPLTQLAGQRGVQVGGNPPNPNTAQANVSPNAQPHDPVNAAANAHDGAPASATPGGTDASAPIVAVTNAGAQNVAAGNNNAAAQNATHDAGTATAQNAGANNANNAAPQNAAANNANNAAPQNAAPQNAAANTANNVAPQNAAANNAATPPPATNAALPRHPSAAAKDQAESALEQRIAACNGHLGHHAYIRVVYDGATGQASTVEFTGHTLDGNPLTTCLEAAVRAVPVPPFRDEHWETRYTFMIR